MKTVDWRLFGLLLVLPVSVVGLLVSGLGLSMILHLEAFASAAFSTAFAVVCYVAIVWGLARREPTPRPWRHV